MIFSEKCCLKKIAQIEERWPRIFGKKNNQELKRNVVKRLQTAKTEQQFESKVVELLDEMRRQQMQHDAVSSIKSLEKAKRTGMLHRLQEKDQELQLVDLNFLTKKLQKKVQKQREHREAPATAD